MQLVLGTRHGTGLGSTGAPLPAPPERWRLSERARRNLRRAAWALAFAGLAALGALHGATTAIGAEGVSALASAPAASEAKASDERAPQPENAGFWRPDGSNAERPPAKVAPLRWEPKRGD